MLFEVFYSTPRPGWKKPHFFLIFVSAYWYLIRRNIHFSCGRVYELSFYEIQVTRIVQCSVCNQIRVGVMCHSNEFIVQCSNLLKRCKITPLKTRESTSSVFSVPWKVKSVISLSVSIVKELEKFFDSLYQYKYI